MQRSDQSSNYSRGTPETEKPFDQQEWLDVDAFPVSQNSMKLSWRLFTQDFRAIDKKLDDTLKDICEKNKDKMLDLRPYMIENVHKCTRFDYLPVILNTFRFNHLRHLVVVNPINNRLEGIITRQDIFMYMPL